MDRKELEAKALAALELKKRYDESRILWYVPCSPKHKAFHESEKPIRIAFGGNRSGKSMAGLMELLFHACFKTHPFTKKPNPLPGRYRIFTTKFQIAEELIVPLLQEWVPKKALRGNDWKEAYDSRYHILHLKGGTTIDILTYDQDASVAESVALDGIWADEEMPERMFSGSITRLISKKGKMWMTVTPLYSMTWAMRFLDNIEDPNVDVFKFSIFDNPHLDPASRDAIIANWPEHERAARISGDFLEFAGLVYKEIDRDVHLLKESKQPDPSNPVIFAMDPHPRKATVMTWAYVTPQEDVVFFDELEMKGTAKEIADAVRRKEASHKAPTALRIIDPAARAQGSSIAAQTDTLREFEKEGLDFSLADNSEAGYNVVHEYLQWEKTQPLGGLNRPRCYFTKDCPKTWYGMTHLLWDEWTHNKDSREEKERIKDKYKDFPDCVRYTLILKPQAHVRSGPARIGSKITAKDRQTHAMRRMFGLTRKPR